VKPQGRLASFEDWSDFVRGAVCWIRDKKWLNVEDPVKSILSNEDEDPETTNLAALLKAWNQSFEQEPKTVGAAIKAAEEDKNGALYEALDEIAGEHGFINSKRLGKWIKRYRGRIVNGMKFEQAGELMRAKRWYESFVH
jgi:hypothetical protein